MQKHLISSIRYLFVPVSQKSFDEVQRQQRLAEHEPRHIQHICTKVTNTAADSQNIETRAKVNCNGRTIYNTAIVNHQNYHQQR